MNIHMGNLISVFSLSVFPFEAGSKNINKDCRAIVSTFHFSLRYSSCYQQPPHLAFCVLGHRTKLENWDSLPEE